MYNGILTTLECHYANRGRQHKREKVDLSVERYIRGWLARKQETRKKLGERHAIHNTGGDECWKKKFCVCVCRIDANLSMHVHAG